MAKRDPYPIKQDTGWGRGAGLRPGVAQDPQLVIGRGTIDDATGS